MDFFGGILMILTYALIGWAVYAAFPHKKVKEVELSGNQDRKYQCTYGNDLDFSTGDTFNGVDIVLPKNLPNMYLDGLSREGLLGPRNFFLPNQQIKLEGNFNERFRLYVVRGSQIPALSILTPDVMLKLMDALATYDIEIRDNHARIAIRSKVYGKPKVEAAVIQAAHALVTAIDFRMSSFPDIDNDSVHRRYLDSENMITVNLFRKKVRLSALLGGVFMGGIGIAVWASIILRIKESDSTSLHSVLPSSIIAFLWFPCLTVFVMCNLAGSSKAKPFWNILQRINKRLNERFPPNP